MISAKVSSCVDCATPIIGDRLRCPACHDQHAATVPFVSVGDEDVTLPRKRSRQAVAVRDTVTAWLATGLVVVVVAVLLMTTGRGCQ